MKFLFENRLHRIRFRYDTRKVLLRGRGEVDQQVTTVFIEETDADRTAGSERLPDKVVMTASVARYFRDSYNRDAARKAALTKALVDALDDFRKQVWAAYHSRVGGIHYKPTTTIPHKQAA